MRLRDEVAVVLVSATCAVANGKRCLTTRRIISLAFGYHVGAAVSAQAATAVR